MAPGLPKLQRLKALAFRLIKGRHSTYCHGCRRRKSPINEGERFIQHRYKNNWERKTNSIPLNPR